MKKIHFFDKISCACMVLCLAMASAFTSCMPDGDVNSGGNGSEVEEKPAPEGVKSVALYSNLPGSQLSGLYFNEHGFLTSDNGWMLAPVGRVPGIGNVDYIPLTNWANQISPDVDLGFVGYHPKEGFVSFLVASIGYDEYRYPFAVGLMYLDNFSGGETPVELEKDIIDFPAAGGTQTVSLKGQKYSLYQMAYTGDWLSTAAKSSVYPFINDRIEVTVQPNTTDAPRSDVISIVTDRNEITTLKVNQSAD
ncbi:MAG: BACON domain-containing protein [Muribaculaceae bacterium]|nr:BACON domain-containing protein [Muribaculaceae bacterium]